ncbi:MAG: hypothetical protein LBM75_05955 [Myxococcales bacterium]|jgi:hypothetical protein|nr:hypothetical protein [Myxococcales bacterium]
MTTPLDFGDDRLISLARHALRAPLANVCGYAQLVESPCLTAAQRRGALASMRQCADSALLLIEHWFDAVRLMASCPDLGPAVTFEDFEMAALVREVLSSRERIHRHARIEFRCLAMEGDGALWARTDRERASKALACLLDATRLTMGAGGAIDIETRQGVIELRRADGEALFDIGQIRLSRAIEEAIAIERGLGVGFHLALARQLGMIEFERAARLKLPHVTRPTSETLTSMPSKRALD